ncbi:lysophospholipase l1 and related esterases [Moorella thermoacetica Y72]|uniref:Lysophospholipase l1 and related esterases n=1 Tax=Moorella thermoacetica Y72 TaxID=1325331 RepID=A0A0S6U9J1_NEOTH|nr:SGNH/GDSL hydrolase family protein [Moorella thermoacetica]GAF24845.1 lysophospholipase l1 and related esterases [Moorella thermoacetica Y72]
MQAIDLVGLGDSLTWGYPFGPEASWLNLAAAETGLQVINRGISGETTGEMLARFDEDVVRPGPRAVTIMGGTNDAWAGLAAAEVESNIRTMIDKARRAGIEVIICLPPPLCRTGSDIPASFLEKMAGLLADYRDACRHLASSRGLELLDFYIPLLDQDTGWGKREFFVDDAHPSIKGYQAMAAVAVDLFRKLKC